MGNSRAGSEKNGMDAVGSHARVWVKCLEPTLDLLQVYGDAVYSPIEGLVWVRITDGLSGVNRAEVGSKGVSHLGAITG